ncbi:MAG TPA: sugar transferase [Candidatus Polarisedimenticolia bacterium]|nr:sugar transferase [Candidatus Polarisedimenticolia bacterium]
MARRLFDIAVSAACLLAGLVPGALAAILVKLTSPGPVLYRQTRVGRGGRPFTLLKFRTMRVAAGGAGVTSKGDPRITAVGGVLRRWKIDELPQFWNVLAGDMSIIGPRPEIETYVRHYTAAQREVLEDRPGLAGMAQLVYPHESELLAGHADPERAYVEELMPLKIKVDVEYKRRRTFFSDLGIALEVALLVAGSAPRMDRSFRFKDHEAAAPAAMPAAGRS